VITANFVTSEPVPEVVGIATRVGILFFKTFSPVKKGAISLLTA